MRLIALVAAGCEADARPGRASEHPSQPGCRALLPLSGMTVIERQVRDLLDAGADLVLVETDRETGDIGAAIEKLRGDGLDCAVVEHPSEILAHVADHDRVLLMADGLAVAQQHLKAIAAASAPAILVTSDEPLTASFERLDATTRWAGLAVVTAPAVAALAALPGEWDMVLTLLRTAVQGGARRIPCAADRFAAGDIAIVTDAEVGAVLDRNAMRRIALRGGGLVGDRLVRPLAHRVAPMLLRSSAACRWLAPLALTGLASTLPVAWLLGTGPAGLVGLSGLLFAAAHEVVTAFRRDSEEATGLIRAIRAAALLLLPLVVAAATIATGGADLEAASSAASAGAFALIVLAARALTAAKAAIRPIRLPDAEAGWLTLAVAGWGGAPTVAAAMLALTGAGMLWWAGRGAATSSGNVSDGG